MGVEKEPERDLVRSFLQRHLGPSSPSERADILEDQQQEKLIAQQEKGKGNEHIRIVVSGRQKKR